MTSEQRLDRLEETDRKLTELMTHVVSMVQSQQGQLDDVVGIIQRQQEQVDDIVGIIQRQQEQLDQHRELLDEVRQDAKMTRRLWVRLATKYGWLDEEDLDGDGG